MEPEPSDHTRPTTEDVAKEVINRIRRNRGDIDKADEVELSKTAPEWQHEYRRKEKERRQILANYTKTTSNQMYLSRSRFIMELLQNADDAEYAPAVRPYLTFRLRRDLLIVDSNELGFTVANVKSICSTGESSKKGDSQTTGEKGLGFKSVFGVANEVHIQSGKWSFHFKHRRGEDGLGMVTPLWTPPSSEPLPPGVVTRFRLSLTNSDPKAIGKLMKEFDDLPDTLVFATRKVTKVEIIYEDVLARTQYRTIEREGELLDGQIEICNRIQIDYTYGTDRLSTTTTFRTITHEAPDMPMEDLRDSNHNSVTLGFQINSETGYPVIPDRGQHVFAFIPVQRLVQLPVLVHADFILGANREGIPEGEWNEALRKGIVQCFILAIEAFTRPDDPLFYKWIPFLPTSSAEEFWDDFHGEVQKELLDRKILQTINGIMREPSELRILPSKMLFDDQPILPDLPFDSVYLSSKYNKQDFLSLRALGLKTLSSQNILDRLKADLQSQKSRIYGTPLENDYHTALTNLLASFLHTQFWEDILKLKVIPLTTSQWVQPEATSETPIYLPGAIDEPNFKVGIPDCLGLQLLHPTQCAVAERLFLYTSLGVTDCDDQLLLQKVLKAQKEGSAKKINDYVAQFQLLFWLGQKMPSTNSSFRACSEEREVMPSTRLFLRTNEQYEAQDLLGEQGIGKVKKYGFLHKNYTLIPAESIPIRKGQTWTSWLATCAGVRSFPSLLDDSNQLHPLLNITALNNSAKFLGCLHRYWDTAYRWEQFSRIEKDLKSLLVTCQNGSRHSLCSTIFPTEALIQRSRKLGLELALPFLQLPENALLRGEDSWKFLQHFGVTDEANLHYYSLELAAAKEELESNRNSDESWCFATCAEIYESIAAAAPLGESQTVKSIFKQMTGIYVPGRRRSWYAADECRWRGPPVITMKPVLQDIYQDRLGTTQLWVNLLEVADASYLDVLLEVQDFQKNRQPSETHLSAHYSTLSEMCKDSETKTLVRNEFLGQSYIYADNRWLKSFQTIWQSTVPFPGRTTIGNLYPELEDFFRKDIGVVTQDAVMLMKEIMSSSKTFRAEDATSDKDEDRLRFSRVIERIREVMVVAGQVIQITPRDEKVVMCLRKLTDCSFLPCRLGESKSLEKPTASFFVVDNERYGTAFAGKLKLLDFDNAEMTFVYPLLDALNLLGTSLSKHVTVMVDAEESPPHQVLSSFLRQRAYAISCCATFHHSAKYFNKRTTMHQLLLEAEVILCDRMVTNLKVCRDGEVVVVQSGRPLLEIRILDEDLKIFVPSREEDLYACFRTELPLQLTKILQIEDQQAIKQFYRIINDESMSLDRIMVEEDIPTVRWLEKPPVVEPTTTSMSGEPRRVASEDQAQSDEFTTPKSRDDSVEERAHQVRSTSPASQVDAESLPTTITPILSPRSHLISYPGSTGTLQSAAHDRLYRRLLERIIRQARGSTQDSFSMSDLENALEDDTGLRRALGLGCGRRLTFEENAKIGAAGELYVFECLDALGLQGFSRENWQSTIRDRVSVVPEYSEIKPGKPPEEADLVYEASTDDFERFLRQKSTLAPFPNWSSFQPVTDLPVKYLVEVKATTEQNCAAAFYMSDIQYNQMKHSHGKPRNLYVICRVYNLLGKVGLEIFVDPWRLNGTGLKFDAIKYRVAPRITR
ncbi:uncharacterized protein A1O9_05306 [Exophiala aquamarina CBS 119918]|uniref:Protein NO VEIN C-terminal domain-containing protein n=1 Tax=Exophiala aquamarina CBS 119918 TaxID=1182545 RepID=A0A072PBB6_9EURO|nr:uncharacterized protein A1O9_05306 [Exophiala aquamarina CBS 119918]KEF57389.1 hypothetical protein A1O9_05306 [Exophiala aquamarina CBS 119918]